MTWEINNLLPTENSRGKKSCPENQGKIAEIPGPRGQNQPENAWKIPTLSPENPRPFPDIPGVGGWGSQLTAALVEASSE